MKYFLNLFLSFAMIFKKYQGVKMEDTFNKWNEIKKSVQNENLLVGFKDREIFYMKMGKNVGYEQDGKGDEFVRPVVILKGFNESIFFGIPLSTKIKEGKFYYEFQFNKKGKIVSNIALLSQMRLFSTKRLLNKIGVINTDDFKKMKNKLKKLLD